MADCLSELKPCEVFESLIEEELKKASTSGKANP
jgi:hypothetical protein